MRHGRDLNEVGLTEHGQHASRADLTPFLLATYVSDKIDMVHDTRIETIGGAIR